MSLAVLSILTVLAAFIGAPPALAATGPTVTNPGAQYSAVSVAASLQAAASGGTTPYTWTATGLPTGLSINSTSGLASGTPTSAGTYAVTLTATDHSRLAGSASFTWTTGTAPTVTNPGTLAAVMGTAFSKTISATGAKSPYSWTAAGLPGGLGINASTGAITGTPTAAGVSSVTVTSIDANKIPGRATFSMDVAATAAAVVNPGTWQATIGQSTSLTLAGSGGTTPYRWTTTGLPAGLSVSANTGTITGTPTTAASSTVTVTLTDAAGRTATTTFTWVTAAAPTVAGPGAQTGTIGVAVSKTVTAGGGATPYTWSATGLPAGLSIDASSGTITGTPTAGGNFTVAVSATDSAGRQGTASFGWVIAAPVAVTDPGAQKATVGENVTTVLTATGGSSPYTWTATGLPAGLSINANTGAVTGTPSAAGTTSATLTATDSAGRAASIQITWTVTTALTVINPGTQSGSVGVAGSLALQAAGGISPYTWSQSGLPDGLTLNVSTGTVSGTPTNPATWAVTVKVTDKAGHTQTAGFDWTITSPLALTSPGDQNPTQNQAVSITPTATGGAAAYTWTATGLPTGLSLDKTTGKVTGTPTTVGAISSTLTVTDAGGRTASAAIRWRVFQATRNGPVMDYGTVGILGGALASPWGVAVVGDGVYTAVGTQIVRVDKNTGVTTAVAGSASQGGCVSAVNGAAARFSAGGNGGMPARVVGTDGTLIYVLDDCSFAAVDPATGATQYLQAGGRGTDSAAILGHYLYYATDTGLGLFDLATNQGVNGPYGFPHGALAADDNALWSIDHNKLYRFEPATGLTNTVTTTLPASAADFDGIASVGDYLYYISDQRLWRVSKTDGSAIIVAGGTASNDAPLWGYQPAVASDGDRLFVADTNANVRQGWIKEVSIGLRPKLGGLPSSPIMDYGTMTGLTNPATLPYTAGVAAIGDDAYTAAGPLIVGVNRYTGVLRIIAGNPQKQGCAPADTGGQVLLTQPVVLAADGNLLYVYDSACSGSYTVNVVTGATQTGWAGSNSMALNGRDLWSDQLVGGGIYALYHLDRITGQVATIGNFGSSILTTASGLWSMSGSTLWRIDQSSKQGSVALTLPFSPTAVTSAGDSIYAAGAVTDANNKFLGYGIYRIDTLTMGWGLINNGGFFGFINAMAPMGDGIVVDDTTAQALLLVSRTNTPTAPGGPTLAGETAGGNNPSENGQCLRCEGDPVQTDTGALIESGADLTLPAGRGLPPAMTRTYSSELANTRTELGYGWNWAYGMQLTAPQQSSTVVITQENGSTVTFTRQADGTYRAASRVLATLIKNSDGGYTFVRKNVLTIKFDSSGHLQSESDPNGQSLQFTYDGNGHLYQAVDASGRRLTYAWDANNRITTVKDPSAATVTYTYNNAGDLTAVTDPAGHSVHYAYNRQHYLTSVTTPRGGVTTNTYDPAGQVVNQVNPAGQATTFTYTGDDHIGDSTVAITHADGTQTVDNYLDGQLRSVTDAAGTPQASTTSYTYDPVTSQQAAVIDPAGAVTSFTYDTAGNLTHTTDPLHRTTSYTYDGLGDQTSATDPLGKITTATYDGHGNQLLLTTPSQLTQRYSYNSDGTLATATSPGQHTTSYTYDNAGLLTTVTDPDGHTLTYTRDTDGRALSATDNAGHSTSVTYDTAGWLTTSTDADSRTTHYEYDDDRNRTKVTDPAGRTATAVYDLAGRLTSSTDTTGATTTNTYDDANNLTAVTDAAGHADHYTYDLLGQQLTATDPDDGTTHYTYDPDDRLLSTTLPAGGTSTQSYDLAGQLLTSTDPTGHTTSYAYDQAGRLTSSTDPLDRITGSVYDDDGTLTAVTNPDGSSQQYSYTSDRQLFAYTGADGERVTYDYDPAGLLVDKTEPGGLSTHYSYDPAGRIDTVTQPAGSTIKHTYDPAGQLTKLTYSDPKTPAISYLYNADGQRTSMTDGTGTTSYTYDSAGRLTASTNGAGNTVGYTYDTLSRLTALTYPAGNSVTYGYDNAGLMTSATDWQHNTTTFGYNGDGDQTSQTDPNDVTTTIGHDLAGRTTNINTTHNGATIAGYTYSYDAAGQLTNSTDNGTTHTYAHDPLGQVTTVTAGDSAGGYASSSAGLLKTLADGTTQNYNLAQQLATSTPTVGFPTTYAYDGNGNRTSTTTHTSTTTYTYNQTGTLLKATTSTGATVDYAADGDGLRQTRTQNGTTNQLTWGTLEGLPVLLDDGTHRYLYGASLTPYAQVAPDNTIQYLHTDNLGSVRTITDTAGTTIATSTYDTYGNRANHTGTADSIIGYTGNLTDPTTGLIYLRARDYDPTSGQFLTIDPQVDTTRQPYAYAGNNPTQNTDPSGQCPLCVTSAVGAVAGGLIGGGMYAWQHRNDPNFSYADMGKAALKGTVTGALAGLFIPLAGTAAIGALGVSGWAAVGVGALAEGTASAAFTWAQNTIECKPTTGRELALSFATAGAGRVLGAGIGALRGARAGTDAATSRAGRAAHNITGCKLSFAADTDVLMADGSHKAIADIRVGDQVTATDPASGKTTTETVTALWVHQDDVLNLDIDDGHVTTTANHPFWDVTDKQWKQANQLNPGDQILAAGGKAATVIGLRSSTQHHATAYNLTVNDMHTYYVLAGAAPVLVHNCGTDFAPGKATQHYRKHVLGVLGNGSSKAGGADAPEFLDEDEYVQAAKNLFRGEPGEGVYEGTRGTDVLRWDDNNKMFGAMAANGTIKTFFRPDNGVDYFLEQRGLTPTNF